MKSKTYKNPLTVGTISAKLARLMGGSCRQVVIDYSHITHIDNEHLQQIKRIGLSPTLFIKTVLNNYNTVYRGSVTKDGHQSFVLAVYNVPMSNVAAITLESSDKGDNWIVRTAHPVKASQIRRYKDRIIWTKEPTLKAEGG